jgi:hypothetical protein
MPTGPGASEGSDGGLRMRLRRNRFSFKSGSPQGKVGRRTPPNLKVGGIPAAIRARARGVGPTGLIKLWRSVAPPWAFRRGVEEGPADV